MLASWTLVMVLFAMLVTKFGFSWYLMAMIAVASAALDWRLALIVIVLSSASFFLNAWDSASNEVMQLPMLFPASRFYFQLFVGVCAVGLVVLEISRQAQQRHAEYSIE